MACVVIRNKDNPNGFPMKLSAEAVQRARKNLKARGVDIESFPKIVWPEGAVSAYQPHSYAPWQYTTEADLRRQRQEDAKEVLRHKREYGIARRRALYVWAFCVPGWIYGGWWIWIRGVGVDFGHKYWGRHGQGPETLERLLELFPYVEADLFGTVDWEKWIAEFVKRHQKGRLWGGKPQGKAPIWAEVVGSDVKKILGRAEWPGSQTED